MKSTWKTPIKTEKGENIAFWVVVALTFHGLIVLSREATIEELALSAWTYFTCVGVWGCFLQLAHIKNRLPQAQASSEDDA